MDSRVSERCDNCGQNLCNARERWRTLPVPKTDFLDKVALLPVELQEMIYRYYITTDRPRGEGRMRPITCCPPSLTQVNKFWNDKISPLLWEVIQDDELLNIAGVLSLLTGLRRTHPSRFTRLTGFIKTLSLGILDGAALGLGDDPSLEWGHFIDSVDDDRTTWVYDIISYFKNLRRFQIHVLNDSTNLRKDPEAIYERLGKNFTKLEYLHVGGVIPAAILSSIFSASAGHLKHVEMIYLHQGIWRGDDTPQANRPYENGVNQGPDGILFLTDGICQRMTSLQTLVLSKLADIESISPRSFSGIQHGVNGTKVCASSLPWPFARSSELEILQEWALLLRHVAPHLRSLTLENRFLVSPEILFQHDHERTLLHRYNVSVEASRKILMPLFEDANFWPKLTDLHLSGMGARAESMEDWAKNIHRITTMEEPVRFQLLGGTYSRGVESFTCVSEPDACLGMGDLFGDSRW